MFALIRLQSRLMILTVPYKRVKSHAGSSFAEPSGGSMNPGSLGDADKNLDWLCREAQAFTILNGTERAEGNLYTFFVVPANV